MAHCNSLPKRSLVSRCYVRGSLHKLSGQPWYATATASAVCMSLPHSWRNLDISKSDPFRLRAAVVNAFPSHIFFHSSPSCCSWFKLAPTQSRAVASSFGLAIAQSSVANFNFRQAKSSPILKARWTLLSPPFLEHHVHIEISIFSPDFARGFVLPLLFRMSALRNQVAAYVVQDPMP